MDIDIRRWLSIISACSLGWLSGFIIYSIIAYCVIIPKIQSMGPITQSLQPPQVFQNRLSQGSISHAVVHVFRLQDTPRPGGAIYMLQYNYNRPTEPSHSYYL